MQSRQWSEATTPMMGRKGASARWRKWLKLRYLAPLVVGVWAAFYYAHTLHPQLAALQQKHQQLTQQLASLRQQHEQLVHEAQLLQSDAYVAKYASEHFNLVLPGQVPFVVH